MTVIVLVLCGCIISVLSALFGVGGGILIVPVLRHLYPEAPIQSIAATSLMVVMLGSLINIILFRRHKIEINTKKLVIWCCAMLIGVQAGFFLSFLLPEMWIMLGFAITLIILAIRNLLSSHNAKIDSTRKDTFVGSLLCAIGGLIAGVTGLGGGSILAPLISTLSSIQTKQIAVYTNWMMLIGGLGGMWSYISLQPEVPIQTIEKWQVGYINFYVVFVIFISSVLTSLFSMKLRGLISEKWSNLLFSLLLVIIAMLVFVTL